MDNGISNYNTSVNMWYASTKIIKLVFQSIIKTAEPALRIKCISSEAWLMKGKRLILTSKQGYNFFADYLQMYVAYK